MAVTSFKASSMTTGSKRARVWDQSSSPGNFESIATSTVSTAGGAAFVEFNNIPQNYTHLQIRAIARGVVADTDVNLYVRFNGDSSANYSDHGIYGNGSAAAGYGNANNTIPVLFRITANNSTSGRFGAGVADILDYTNTNKFKTYKSLTGHDQNGSGIVFLVSGNWRNTNAITSIRIFESSNNIAQNSTFALYGVL